MAAVEAGLFDGEGGPQVAQRLFEPVEALCLVVEREAKGVVLFLHPTRPDSQPQPSARHLVDRRRRLGDNAGVAECDGAHQHTQVDVGRLASEAGEGRKRIRGVRGFETREQVVVGASERIEAQVLGDPGGAQQLAVCHPQLRLRHQPEFHGVLSRR